MKTSNSVAEGFLFFESNLSVRALLTCPQLEECHNLESSRPEVFCKIGVLRNFAKLTGKYLCQSLFLNKGLRHRCFPMNFAKFRRIPFLQNTSGGCFWIFKVNGFHYNINDFVGAISRSYAVNLNYLYMINLIYQDMTSGSQYLQDQVTTEVVINFQ